MAPRTPIALASDVTLLYDASAFNGVRTPFRAIELVNTYRYPMEVQEIRLMVEAIPSNAGLTIEGSPYVRIEGKVGRHYITDGAVPVSVFAPYRVQSDGIDTFESDTVAAASNRVSVRRLILSKPIYLPPGLGFGFTASIPLDPLISSTVNDFTITVRVVIIGRLLDRFDRPPARNDIPMISACQVTPTATRSLEEHFRNPLSTEMRVKRIVAAAIIDGSSATLGNYLANSDPSSTVEITFPDSKAACEDPVLISMGLFNQMRVWPVDFVMPAGTRLRAKVNFGANDLAPAVGYQFALIGTRSEAV